MSGGRLLVANLDVEIAWARRAAAVRRAAGERGPSPQDPRYALPESVMRRLAVLGVALRCAAREGDRLWTVRPVDPADVPDAPGLPRPTLVAGPRPDPATAAVAWGREDDVAVAVNDRTWVLGVAEGLGLALPGSCAVRSLAEAEAALARAVAASADGAWVLKARHSAAGRSRVRGAGPRLADAAQRRAERLLALHGALVLEPWMRRTADFGACAEVLRGDVADVSFHGQVVGSDGACAAIEAPSGLRPHEETALASAVRAVGARLAAAGYEGPFGVDAWRWTDEAGRERFHALGEVNARWTLGRVARETARRVAREADAPSFLPGGGVSSGRASRRAARPASRRS